MMRKRLFVLFTLFFLAFLAACSGLRYTPIPTPVPVDFIPTIIALTAQFEEQAHITPSPVLFKESSEPSPAPSSTAFPTSEPPTAGPSPTPLAFNPTTTLSPTPSDTPTPNLSPTTTSQRQATYTPTITATPTLPAASIKISAPGPMSRLTSPLQLMANIRSAPSGTYHVEIWQEPLLPDGDARLLYREVQKIISNPMDWIYLDSDIQFELSRVSEFGQLRISVLDKFSRAVAINSVDLILLSMGRSDITPDGLKTEPIVIYQPTPNHLIQGGKVIVSGLASPKEDILVVEMVAADGSVAGYSQVFVQPSPDGSYVPYTIEVPYSVAKGTWVRLQVYESGVRIPGIEHLSSVEVYLSP